MTRFLLGPTFRAKPVVDGLERAVVAPLVEVPPDGTLGWEVFGQITSLTTRLGNRKDGIDNITQIGRAWPSAEIDRQMRLGQSPLPIGHVTRVDSCSYTPFYAVEPLWDSLEEN